MVQNNKKKYTNFLEQDPAVANSTPLSRLVTSIWIRIAVKFNKEHLFFIWGAFKCSLKCPNCSFLFLFHNGFPFWYYCKFSMWLKKPQSHCGISFEICQEKQGRKLKFLSLITFYYHSPFPYFLGVFIFCNYSTRLHWTWIPQRPSTPVCREAQEN